MAAQMSIDDAVEQGIAILRQQHWAPHARLILKFTGRGAVSPWATVEDVLTDAGIVPIQRILICMLDRDENVWEPLPRIDAK